MKKTIALLLSFILIISCSAIAVSAVTTKISESLQQIMKATPNDEKIEVQIFLYSNVDKAAARQQAIKECGYIGGLPLNMTLDEVYAYNAAYNRIISEYETAAAESFVEKLGIAKEDIVYLGSPCVIAKLTKEQINTADTFAEVESIDYDDSPAIEPTDTQVDKGNIYEDKVKEIYPFLYEYSELYYHSDNNGDVDWVLITGEEAAVIPEPLYMVIGNRVIIEEEQKAPFGFGMAVYDVVQDKVSPIYEGMLNQYDGLEEAFNKYGCGRLIGDIDGDDNTTVLDATLLQKYSIGKADLTAEQLAVADVNKDNNVDILDATAIQKYAAA